VWEAVFSNWERWTLPDLAQYPHIDAYDLDAVRVYGQPADRPWRWLRGQIIALLDIPDSRLARALQK